MVDLWSNDHLIIIITTATFEYGFNQITAFGQLVAFVLVGLLTQSV